MIDSFVGIIPAAGSGARFSEEVPKQFLKIDDRTILELSIKPLLDFSECEGVCLVVAPDDQYHKSLELVKNSKVFVIEGGKTRIESVSRAIDFWKDSSISFKNILIHDSVRPCLRSSDVRMVLELMGEKEHDGVVLGVPCTDTLKEVEKGTNEVKKTKDRSSLWTAFTPQIFKKEVLVNAISSHDVNKVSFTDESCLIEANDGKIKMIQGSRDNIKITFPNDLILAKSILISQGRVENIS